MVYGRGLDLANEGTGEEIVVNIFVALLGVVSVSALAAAFIKIMLSPPKIWVEDLKSEEIEEIPNYEEIRKGNPHIWID
jgi:hypothetical protein